MHTTVRLATTVTTAVATTVTAAVATTVAAVVVVALGTAVAAVVVRVVTGGGHRQRTATGVHTTVRLATTVTTAVAT
ncbi:hypothetical protein, partial [Streptomyces sp. NPDC018056]|uniref:hypothetical protein n=1 Tax=Streptomyces sp. NPDC018056 TaxID=3365039 RepID=UPI00379BA718